MDDGFCLQTHHRLSSPAEWWITAYDKCSCVLHPHDTHKFCSRFQEWTTNFSNCCPQIHLNQEISTFKLFGILKVYYGYLKCILSIYLLNLLINTFLAINWFISTAIFSTSVCLRRSMEISWSYSSSIYSRTLNWPSSALFWGAERWFWTSIICYSC